MELRMRREVDIISRVTDRAAAPDDWDQLVARGDADPAIYRQLVEALRVEQALGEVGPAIAPIADQERPLHPPVAWTSTSTQGITRWLGWAAAAFFFALWATPESTPGDQAPAEPGLTAAPAPAETESPSLSQQLVQAERDGRIVGSLPTVVLGTGKVQPDGSHELLFVRRVLERPRKEDLPSYAIDELGRITSPPLTGIQPIESM